MLETPYPPAITSSGGDQYGENAQKSEPKGLIEVRLEGEAKARAGVIPDPIIIARYHAKGIRTWRKAGVVGGPTIAGVDPVFVEPIEPILEERALRYPQTKACVMKFPPLGPRRNFCPVGERQRCSINSNLLDDHGWRQRVGTNMTGVYPDNAPNARKPKQSVRCRSAGTGVAAVEFGAAQTIFGSISMKLRGVSCSCSEVLQCAARNREEALVGGEPELVRAVLQQLIDV